MNKTYTITVIDNNDEEASLTSASSSDQYATASITAFLRIHQKADATHFMALHCEAAIHEIVDYEVEGGCSEEEWSRCKASLEAAISMLVAIGYSETVKFRKCIEKAKACLAECG